MRWLDVLLWRTTENVFLLGSIVVPLHWPKLTQKLTLILSRLQCFTWLSEPWKGEKNFLFTDNGRTGVTEGLTNHLAFVWTMLKRYQMLRCTAIGEENYYLLKSPTRHWVWRINYSQELRKSNEAKSFNGSVTIRSNANLDNTLIHISTTYISDINYATNGMTSNNKGTLMFTITTI